MVEMFIEIIQMNYNVGTLIKAKHEVNELRDRRPKKPIGGGSGPPPEDIGQYINAVSILTCILTMC